MLRYGGGASAGVVNAITNRVPQVLLDTPVTAEALGIYGTNEDQGDAAGVLDGAFGNLAWHLDGLYRYALSVTSDPDLRHTAHPASRVGVEAIYEHFPESFKDGSIHMAVARQGYVGLTRIVGDRLHVAAAVDRSALQASGPDDLVQNVLRAAGVCSLPRDESVSAK